jgi:glutamate racemase
VKQIVKGTWRSLRRKLLKVYVKLNKRMIREEAISQTQKNAMKILKKMMVSPESEMMIAPISGTHYIHWKDVFARFNGDKVQIINGKYFYDIWLTAKQSDEILDFFRHRLENRRKKMEIEIMDKTNRSLETILQEIENEEKHRINESINN